MKPKTYVRLIPQLPELALPPWEQLSRTARLRARRFNREQLIAHRVTVLLCGENPFYHKPDDPKAVHQTTPRQSALEARSLANLAHRSAKERGIYHS